MKSGPRYLVLKVYLDLSSWLVQDLHSLLHQLLIPSVQFVPDEAVRTEYRHTSVFSVDKAK